MEKDDPHDWLIRELYQIEDGQWGPISVDAIASATVAIAAADRLAKAAEATGLAELKEAAETYRKARAR